MHIGIAADHGGFELKGRLGEVLKAAGHQVGDDDMNVICLGARVIGYSLAMELIRTFLAARFEGEERFQRRLNKAAEIEKEEKSS